MTHLIPLLAAVGCIAMMFGAGAIAWLVAKTPLRRVSAIARRADARPTRDAASTR
jgi:hypothetical protein